MLALVKYKARPSHEKIVWVPRVTVAHPTRMMPNEQMVSKIIFFIGFPFVFMVPRYKNSVRASESGAIEKRRMAQGGGMSRPVRT